MGCRLAVRQRILIPSCGGSIPPTPATWVPPLTVMPTQIGRTVRQQRGGQEFKPPLSLSGLSRPQREALLAELSGKVENLTQPVGELREEIARLKGRLAIKPETVPPGSRFKGYVFYSTQDLVISVRATWYKGSLGGLGCGCGWGRRIGFGFARRRDFGRFRCLVSRLRPRNALRDEAPCVIWVF